MTKYVMYYNITNLPTANATERLEKIKDDLRSSGIVEESDKLAIIGILDGYSRLEVVD